MTSEPAPRPTLATPATPDWSPTREAGLKRLHAFLPHAGRAYAAGRNVDRGPHDRSNVSGLSAWIRRRMITEEEVIAGVLRSHAFSEAEKFIQEVFWRAYWKGWLEMRPSVYAAFAQDRDRLWSEWAGDARLKRALDARSGIEPFDGWMRELLTTGWLHNHARMWFASIWIFTLKLPWQLGADVFLSHLIDADPASNTLSWRWVGGLHTPGKHYLARAANIRENTLGRYNPQGALNETAGPLQEDAPLPPPGPAPQGQKPSGAPVALLVTEEDLHPESWELKCDVRGCAILATGRSGAADTPAGRFSAGALDDTQERLCAWRGQPVGRLEAADLPAWMKGLGVSELVTGYAPAGPTAHALDQVEQALSGEGLGLVRLLRTFDARSWPHARAGFFRLREKIPLIIAGAS